MSGWLTRTSLRHRLLWIPLALLIVFLTLVGVALDRAFLASIERSAEEQLELHVYGLLGAAENREAGLHFPHDLPDARLSQPRSGLYAVVVRGGEVVWRSPSSAGLDLGESGLAMPVAGRFEFERLDLPGIGPVFRLGYGVIWVDAQRRETSYALNVFASEARFLAEVQGFRATLYLWLGVLGVGMTLASWVLMSWVLRPLSQMVDAVHAVESGSKESLGHNYPPELALVTGRLDAMIEHERELRKRYRTSLDDLAHALKTPLAVLKAGLDPNVPLERALLEEQVDRMDGSIGHHLRRASFMRSSFPAQPLPIGPVCDKLLTALAAAYRDKHVIAQCDVGDSTFEGDERDLMELLGNLLENAFKYCEHRVRVSAKLDEEALSLWVDDDGPGIAPDKRGLVLQRGMRADSAVAGHGIGLAVVVDVLSSYGGELEIGDSTLGGSRILIRLPRRGTHRLHD